jgi:glycosyltransferase involved in cell wall biosynthesis
MRFRGDHWPKISIVTPSYNQAPFLEAAIRSVLDQEYPNLEYVVIDGGSKDESVEIIKRYADRLHFWKSEKDEGHYYAVNEGFSHCSGEVMAFLNSDDMYFAGALWSVGSIFRDLPEVEWLTSLRPGAWDWHGHCTDVLHRPGFSREAFLDGLYVPKEATPSVPVFGHIAPIQQESTFWRRSLWERTGSYITTRFRYASDFETWSRFYQEAHLYGTRTPIAGFRTQGDQRTVYDNYVAEASDALRKMRDAMSWTPDSRRSLALKTKMHRIPGVRTHAFPLYSYTGKRVVRRCFYREDGYWEAEDHEFHIES